MIFSLNGKRTRMNAHPMKRLLDVLRERLWAHRHEKRAAGKGECGACTVLLDARRSPRVWCRWRTPLARA